MTLDAVVEPVWWSEPWPDGTEFPPHQTIPEVDLYRVVVPDTRRWRRLLGKLPGIDDDPTQEVFQLRTRIGYRDSKTGARIVVPRTPRFTTDLVSVPTLFTWLVPRSGRHLPAALVHDGLVGDEREYEIEPDGTVDRIDADRIFRDAMGDTEVGRIRRWLVWAAVSTASLCSGARASWPRWYRVWYWFATAVTVGCVLALGAAATLDLFDVRERWWSDVPWMDGSCWEELAGGLAGAVVVPFALAILWGRYARVGLIVGVALATLLHVTVAVMLVAIFYQVAEWVLQHRWTWRAVSSAVVAASFLIFGIFWLTR